MMGLFFHVSLSNLMYSQKPRMRKKGMRCVSKEGFPSSFC